MVVGFHVDYNRSDELFAAFRLAKHLESMGVSVQFLPADRASRVDDYWDTKVLKNYRGSYSDWLDSLQHLVMTAVPPTQIMEDIKDSDVFASLLCFWTNLSEVTIEQIKKFNRIICPSKTVYRHLRDTKRLISFKNLLCVQWDYGGALIRNDRTHNTDRVGLYLNMDGSQPFYQAIQTINLIERIMTIPNVYLSVAYTSRIPENSLAELRRIAADAKGRIELFKNMSLERAVLTAAAHDLTIWPNIVESANLPGLISLTAGTPCLAFDHPVIGDVIKDRVNGVLVPCELDFDWFGVPEVVFDGETFFQQARQLITDHDLLAGLSEQAHYKLIKRRESFENSINSLFGL